MSAATLRGLGRFAPRAAVDREGTRETDSPLLRLAAFTALAAFATAHWATLVADAPTLRLTGAVAAAVAVGAALASLRYVDLPRPAVWAMATAISIAGLALAVMSVGLPARLLPPGAWDELANELDRGLSGIRTVEWPYDGSDEPVRLAILLGAPLLLSIAAALSFWPARRGATVLRGAGLLVLLVLYGTAVTENDPGEPLARGFVLLLLLAAWLWLPRLGRREAIVGTLVVLAVGIGAVPLANALNRDVALVDYQSWNWFGGKDVVFDWNHSYGPLDWPRDGTTLLNVESDRPLYWKAETLETFDGLRWVRTDQNQSTSPLGEIPDEADPKWLERIRVTVRSLRTDFVIVAGTPVEPPEGAGGSLSQSSDGTIRSLAEPLERGDSYTVNSYSPNPKPAELRAIDRPYDLELLRYTRIGLPGARDAVSEPPGAQDELLGRSPATSVEVPLRGDPGGDIAGTRAALANGPYARTQRLAQRLTNGAPTAYAAVRNVEQHLQEGFTYSERPPTHPYPLEAFLFEDKLGYCQQFAGTMALMLRMAGIPARVVSGFSPGSFNRDTGEYRVRDLDAHSWVEVFYPTIGWVTHDPTPTTSPAVTAGQGAEARDRNGSAFSAPGNGGPGASDRSLEPGGGGAQGSEALGAGTVVLVLLVLLLSGAGAVAALRLRRSRRLTPLERSEARLRELERALPRLGWRLEPGSTLLELERRLRSAAGPTTAGYVAGLREGRFYAHHPYPATPAETPSSRGCKNCPWITMATIRKLLFLVNRSFGSKPIWLTEYGYQTNPPDTFLGVPLKRQARVLSLAAMRAWRLPRVTMLIQFLYRDEPTLSRFQTGLVFTDDRWKPSLQAFRLPFAQMGRRGLHAMVWGQIRDGRPGRKRYRLEVLRRNVWRPVGRARLTNDDGVFIRTIRVKRGALFRIWSPSQRRFSQQLRIR